METGGGASDEGGKQNSTTGIDANFTPDFRDKEESNKMTKEDKAVSPNSLPRCHAVTKQVIYGEHQPTPPPPNTPLVFTNNHQHNNNDPSLCQIARMPCYSH